MRHRYHTVLIAVCTRAGFVPEQDTDELREAVEEYIFERAFQAESPEEEEEDEETEPSCRNSPHDNTTDKTESRRFPAVTAPENTGQNSSGQEPA